MRPGPVRIVFSARRRRREAVVRHARVGGRGQVGHHARRPADVVRRLPAARARARTASGAAGDARRAGGALVVGFHLRDVLAAQTAGDAPRGVLPGPPDARQIDTWLAIYADNTATVYVGFAELGQGASTALLQIAAEELDLDMGQIKSVRLDTNVTPNQGGTYSSASINRGGPQVRTAAAEARQALLKLASAKLNTGVGALTVAAGVVTAAGTGSRVTYGELVGGKLFEIPFTG